MTPEEVEATLRAIVARHSRPPGKVVHRDAVLATDLEFDSLALLLTLGDLEREFGILFPVEKVDELRDISFGKLVKLVVDELEGKGPSVR